MIGINFVKVNVCYKDNYIIITNIDNKIKYNVDKIVDESKIIIPNWSINASLYDGTVNETVDETVDESEITPNWSINDGLYCGTIDGPVDESVDESEIQTTN